MMPLLKMNGEHLRMGFSLHRLIYLRSMHAFRYNFHVEAGNG